MKRSSTAVENAVIWTQKRRFEKLIKALTYASVALGITLRTVQYTANTSLWLDEIALVKGILSFDLFSLLTRQLPFDQVAPKGFLLAQKLAVLTFGPNDYVLRFVPFVCSLIALIAFSSLVRRGLSPLGAFVATLLFATAAPFIAFAGIVKQYSADVCAAVLLSWFALDLMTQPVTERKAWCAGIVGAILQLFSQPAVLMAAALACPVMFSASTYQPNARRRRVAITIGLWGASALVMTVWSLATMSRATRDYMRLYWADGLAPASLARILETGWPWLNIKFLFGGGPGMQAGLAYPFSPLYPALALAGLSVLWIRQRRVAFLLLAPIAVALGAAIARQYPFSDRLILFLVPSLIMAIAVAIAALYGFMERFSKPVALITVMAAIVPAVMPVARTLPPYRVEDVKSVLRYIQPKREPTDAVYVYYGAAPVISMYDTAFGFARDTYTVGGCHRGDSQRYLEELDTFRGKPRVWIIMTHSLLIYKEREDSLAYLNKIGTRLDYVVVESRAVARNPLPAEGFLYDLSGLPRLASADAKSFQLTGPKGTNQRNTCVTGPQAMIPSDFQ